MKIIATIFKFTGKMIVTLTLVGIGLLFSLNFISNYEGGKENWRNYELQFSFEDGISSSYRVPVTEILLDSAVDTVEDCLYLVDYVVDEIG